MISFLLSFIIILSSASYCLANGWYSTLQGAASDVEQTPPPDGVGLVWVEADHQWEFSYAYAPSGGTTGQVLEKNSNSNYDYSWQTIASAVSSVSNTDGSLIISPTTGLVNAGINWSDLTQINITGVNWSNFYPVSNPFNYINGNQTITLSGTVTGSGTTAITTSISNQGIQSSGINWNNINSLNPINTGGVNWQSISNYATNNILQATTAGGVNWTSDFFAPNNIVAISSNAALAGNNVYLVDTTSPRTLTLPTPTNGTIIWIKDKSFNAAIDNITVARHASENIEGTSASLILQTNGVAVELLADGTNWYIVGE